MRLESIEERLRVDYERLDRVYERLLDDIERILRALERYGMNYERLHETMSGDHPVATATLPQNEWPGVRLESIERLRADYERLDRVYERMLDDIERILRALERFGMNYERLHETMSGNRVPTATPLQNEWPDVRLESIERLRVDYERLDRVYERLLDDIERILRALERFGMNYERLHETMSGNHRVSTATPP
ncbi:hypothetical protein [Sporosarcina ureae]|uniref:hypothetical protein n=1 Tax=Sporosarcina ureae TaxID=1571 RepID=UPI0012EC596F|nr:hypothetical protein [Sporosarcina ureae]